MQVSDKYRSKRSSILYTITILVVAVFIVFGVLATLVFTSSQDKLIEKSKDKLIQSEVENVYSSINYITDLLSPVFYQKVGETPTADLINALVKQQPTEAQTWMNEEMSKLVNQEVLGLEKAMLIVTESPISSRPLVLAANEDDLTTGWTIPDILSDAMENEKEYILVENGIPEMGLSGELLVSLKRLYDPVHGVTAYFVGVTSLQDKVDEINSFFDQEKHRTDLLLFLVLIVSILVIVAITFFVLSYLLRKRITEPINQLSAAAEEIMDGNLDVEVPVRKGEELEKLKTVFNEMVRSIREVIDKSIGM
jgi:nitrogen fixation/metabolism regulation signal transduction histidine kinase